MKEKTEDFSASWVEMGNDDNKSPHEAIGVGSIVSIVNYVQNYFSSFKLVTSIQKPT